MALIKVNSRGQSASNGGRKNLIINGDMKIAQRATAATQAGNGTYDTVDRMMTWSVAGGGTFTGSQSTGHQLATGHDTAYKVDVTGADTSIASGDYYEILQRIEGRNLQHLRWGTAAAKKLQVSFWVRATKTGINALFCSKQGTGTDYRNVVEYTINASDTWEHKTVEIPALTASTIANDASTYVQVGFILAMGSAYQSGTAGTWTTNSFYTTANAVNHMDSTSNDFYVTGVQVEVGDEATDFEHRSFGEELTLCQRYFYKFINTGLSDQFNFYSPYSPAQITAGLPNSSGICPMTFPTTMRASPTVATTISGGTLNRQTSTPFGYVAQIGTTSTGTHYITQYLATAEL